MTTEATTMVTMATKVLVLIVVAGMRALVVADVASFWQAWEDNMEPPLGTDIWFVPIRGRFPPMLG